MKPRLQVYSSAGLFTFQATQTSQQNRSYQVNMEYTIEVGLFSGTSIISNTEKTHGC